MEEQILADQRSAEWFSSRLGRCTASRVADIMATNKSGPAASRKNYMAELIAQRLTGTSEENFTSKSMQWGVDNEPLARAAYEAKTFSYVEETGFVLHPYIKHFGASPDGLVELDGLVEIKCPNTATHLATLSTDRVDVDYVRQMYAQGSCTGRKWCDFVSYDPRLGPDMELFIYRLHFEISVITEIEDAVKKFLYELEETVDKLFLKRPDGKDAYIERWRK
jgi:putative phage-type endonuclease